MSKIITKFTNSLTKESKVEDNVKLRILIDFMILGDDDDDKVFRCLRK